MQALDESALPVTSHRPLLAQSREGEGFHAVRKSEWVIFVFFAYATALAHLLPVAASVRSRIVLDNLCLAVIYGVVVGWQRRYWRSAAGIIRDWLPLAAVLLAYREMGWFALPHADHAIESHWVVWDRIFLNVGGRSVIEALGPLVPSVLEIAYAMVYTLAPISVALLYLARRRAAIDRFLFPFLLGVLFCYAQFPFWPSEPPRTLFPGLDLPTYDTTFRHLNLWMLGNYGIHTSVFPSAHVGGAFSTAFGMRQAAPDKKWAFRSLLVAAGLIAVATVYGRYHYLADATAGLVMAVLAAVVARNQNRIASTHIDLSFLACRANETDAVGGDFSVHGLFEEIAPFALDGSSADARGSSAMSTDGQQILRPSATASKSLPTAPQRSVNCPLKGREGYT